MKTTRRNNRAALERYDTLEIQRSCGARIGGRGESGGSEGHQYRAAVGRPLHRMLSMIARRNMGGGGPAVRPLAPKNKSATIVVLGRAPEGARVGRVR
jgi:hypothetical protein